MGMPVLSRLLAVAYMALISAVSISPALEVAPRIWMMDKAVHFAAYAVMGALLMRAGLRAHYAVSIAFVYGVFIEVCQSYVPERHLDALDATANALGALAGAIVFNVLTKTRVSGHADRRSHDGGV